MSKTNISHSKSSKRLMALTYSKDKFIMLKSIFLDAERAEHSARSQRQRVKETDESSN